MICEYCRNENASWLTHSVHADCFNVDPCGGYLPKAERECDCDCCYPIPTPPSLLKSKVKKLAEDWLDEIAAQEKAKGNVN